MRSDSTHQRAFSTGFFTAAALLVLCVLCPANAPAAERIAVFISSSATPFEEAFAGFRDYLKQQGIEAEYDVSRSAGNADRADEAANAKKDAPRMVLTFGSTAADAVARAAYAMPVVSCMVLRTDSLLKNANTTGVGLEFPLRTQLKLLQAILPRARTIGIIYNPDENEEHVAAAVHAARDLGLTLEAVAVQAPQDVPSALTTLSKKVDVLWGLPDTLTLSPQLAKYILLFSFRNKIPFIGPSDAWVRSGALYALDWDYRDLGAQCGDLAVRILRGAPAGSLPPATPGKAPFSLNLKTAQQMKITIPEEIVNKARNVY